MSTQRVLVVDDEPKIRMTVRGYLEADGFHVLEAADGPSALQAVTRDRPDLVVLDVMLPGLDGFQVLRRIREASRIPVILLTARDEEVDRLIGFTTGGDDYVTKPFSPRELALRVRAILRRTETAHEDGVLRFDGLTVDPGTRTVLVDADRMVELSALDFDLLFAMARVPGRVFTRRGLLAQVWGGDFFGDERVVDVHIRTLRRALGDDASAPRFVGTVRTIGYRFIGRPAQRPGRHTPMPPSGFPVDHRRPGRLRRIGERLSLRNRLVLSHVMVLLLALLAMAATSALIEVWLGLDDVKGDVVLQVGLWFGVAAAFPASVALSRFLLRPLDKVRTATRRLAEGHYDDILELPSEPGLAALVEDVNTLAAALADTERRRARLISEVAHEMRTPITLLRGQIEGVADGIFIPDEAMFASLTDDLDRLQRLAGDLSSLSRSEEGAFDLHRELTDVATVARATAQRLRPQYDDQMVILVVDAGTPVDAFCDPDRITQVLVNLLGNALAACDRHGQVTLSVHTEPSPVHHVIVRVIDDGIGIAQHDLERIFHRFERVAHPGRPAASGGSGIGLAIARGIARAHGGDITAESAGLGKGATFTLRLPREPALLHGSFMF